MNRIDLTGNGGTICCIPQNGTVWRVNCTEKSIQRMQEWSKDPVMKKMLEVLRCIPNILVPQHIPKKDAKSYLAWSSVKGKEWFCASELSDHQSLREHNDITVNELWTAAADLCQTLLQLYRLGIWGNAGRGSILLEKQKKSELKYCLAGITDFHLYKYAQLFPKVYCANEIPVTTGLRLMIGSLALCTDLDGEATGCSLLERQIGAACTENLSEFFRAPSQFTPVLFLEAAEKKLRLAAEHLRLEAQKEICLYLVVLGPDCRRTAIPALSSLTRSFYHCVQELDPKHSTKISAVCIYPWDTIRICRLDERCIFGLSALDRNQGHGRPVLLGGLLDCLNRELEQTMRRGTAALVCYITLPVMRHDSALTCMDVTLFQELVQKHRTELCEAFICSTDLQQKTAPRYNRLKLAEKEVRLDSLDAMMYVTIKRLLSIPYYSFSTVASPLKVSAPFNARFGDQITSPAP